MSVCLPVFNGGQHLNAAIQSVLAQTERDFELIIVDDGSTDGSREMAQDAAFADNRIKFFANSIRLGLFGNYNEAMARARGAYIKTFAQDDLLEPDAISAMAAILDEKPEVALVTSARRWIDGGGNQIDLRAPFGKNIEVPAREVLTFNLINLANWVGEPSTAMFRARAKGSGFDRRYFHYGDIEFWFRVLEHGSYFYINDVLCNFRRHKNSQTDKNHKELFFALDIVRLSMTYRHVLEDIEPEDVLNRRLAESVALHLRHITDGGVDPLEYQKAFLEGFELATGEAEHDRYLAAGFRLLSVVALQGLSQTIAELDHEKRCRVAEHEQFVAEVEKMRSSLVYKLTNPLRQVKNAMKGDGGN